MRILLVEDQPDIASMYSLGLQAAGHEVVVAVNGREGLGQAAEMRPGIIVLDVGLPDMSGLDVLEVLRRCAADLGQRLPIPPLTNYSAPIFPRRAEQLGPLNNLVKTEVRPPGLRRSSR